MDIELKDNQGVPVVGITGEIDMHSSPELRKELMALIKKKSTPLLVDFANVSYIDSSGIATLVECLKSMMKYEGKLKLFGIHQQIMDIFNFSKLDQVFEIYGSIDEALSS